MSLLSKFSKKVSNAVSSAAKDAVHTTTAAAAALDFSSAKARRNMVSAMKAAPGQALTGGFRFYEAQIRVARFAAHEVAPHSGVAKALSSVIRTKDQVQRAADADPKGSILVGAGAVLAATGVGSPLGTKLIAAGAASIAQTAAKQGAAAAADAQRAALEAETKAQAVVEAAAKDSHAVAQGLITPPSFLTWLGELVRKLGRSS